ncbi:MAG: hypothetical protein D6729_09010 [Deltaproteobacteria bacterium]|nr:MAG: hypothetical protein D6729_09010 [Deltaproteobacteria bacterium]
MKKGPIEDRSWRKWLTARVATADRLHGYAVEDDLACHYTPSEVLFLALTGRLPDEACRDRLHRALVQLGHTSIAEAPVHAAVLARLCGAEVGGVLQTGLLALVEQARALVSRWRAGEPVPSLVAAGLDELKALGVEDDAQLVTFMVSARIGPLAAEALAHRAGALKSYPMRLPDYVYEGARDGS